MKKKFGWNKFRTDLAIKETDPNVIYARKKAQKFIKEHPDVPVVDVPPVEQSDTVESVNNNRMLAGWGRYNYMECADKGSHDMRLAFIAGYKRALDEAANKVMMICNANDYLACRAVLNEAATAIRSLKQSNSVAEDEGPCADCGRPKSDSAMHLDSPGKGWGAALHWFKQSNSVRMPELNEKRGKPR